jgi:hypothetical protein
MLPRLILPSLLLPKPLNGLNVIYIEQPSDLGIRAQLKNNRTNSCLDNPCSKTIPMPVGSWQKKGGCSKTCDGGIQQYECIGQM